MARIVVIGGTGYAGSHIAREAVSRGHETVIISRSVPDAPTMQKVLAVASQYGSDQIVNNIGLSGAQQVNLQVRILEAQRSAGRELGINWRYGVPSVDPSTGVVNGTYGAPGGSGAGAIDEDLSLAIREALKIDRKAVRAYAEKFSWPECAAEFIRNLEPYPEPARTKFWKRLRQLRRKKAA